MCLGTLVPEFLLHKNKMPAPVPYPMRRRSFPPLLSKRTEHCRQHQLLPRYRFHTALTAPSQPAPEKRSADILVLCIHPPSNARSYGILDTTAAKKQPVHNICDPAGKTCPTFFLALVAMELLERYGNGIWEAGADGSVLYADRSGGKQTAARGGVWTGAGILFCNRKFRH